MKPVRVDCENSGIILTVVKANITIMKGKRYLSPIYYYVSTPKMLT